MRIAVFSTRAHDRRFLEAANADDSGNTHELHFLEARLDADTAGLARDCEAVCAFVNDSLDADVLERLHGVGVRFIALRSAGFNHVDIPAAERLELVVARVPAYSPHSIAEHCFGLVLSLNRHIHRAYNRVRDGNLALDGLMGFDLHGRTIGIVGTGTIGTRLAEIATLGFGMRALAFDVHESERCREIGVEYVALEDLLGDSDVVSLHCPLTDDTHHLIDARALASMKPGAMLINTSRGALVDTAATIDALRSGHLGHLGLDVYEEEDGLFFDDHSDDVARDEAFVRLVAFPNVLVTGHQGFFTEDAMRAIARTTIDNASAFEAGQASNRVTS